jgi:two-component system sensor histidine kinase NreB
VEDDGRDLKHSSLRRGAGMFSMQERAKALGGEVRVESEPGKGTKVRVRLPFRHAQEQ